jgi:Tfp pilus assembly protein PilO
VRENFLERIFQDKKKVILAALVFLIIFYLDYAVILRFQQKSIKRLRSKTGELKKDLVRFEKDLEGMRKFKLQEAKEEGAGLKSKRLIREEQVTAFLQDISKVANNNEVVMASIKPNLSTASEEKKNPESEKIFPLLINLELYGDYHHFGKFLNDLENGNTLVEVENMKIISQPQDYLKQKVNLVLKTYVKK